MGPTMHLTPPSFAFPAVRTKARRVRPSPWLLAALLALSGCASLRVDRAAQVATGFASHVLCNDVFVSGVDPERAYAERLRPLPGMAPAAWLMRRQVDSARREVTVSLAGGFASRARHRPGLGCLVLPVAIAGGEADAVSPALAEPAAPPASADPMPGAAPGPRLAAVLARAIPDAADAQPPATKALVVLHEGRLIGERYAPGYGVDTALLGFSATKSVTNALIGILVRQGRLGPTQAAPVAAWQSPGDARAAITVEQLLRQTSGLDLPQDNSGFDATSQIMYGVRDKAAASAAAGLAAAPGSRWNYTDTNYMLLSRILRDATGGSAQRVLRFAEAELFGPLGMRRVAFDVDATGTPLGSSHLMASARDWARFGQLYLDDGVVAGRRILPAGWVAWSTTPTLSTGYGAGFWTNRLPGKVPGWGAPWGLSQAPGDSFFARGFMGQFVVVIPSRRLVIVRLSVAPAHGDDIHTTDRLVGDILAALAGDAAAAR